MSNITATVETITPELARAYLGFNTKNRRLKDRRIQAYARDMKAWNWRLTGEAIKFDSTGRMIDGQNRCHAVIEADTPVRMLVIRGVAPDAMDVLDSGAPRSAADALGLRGTNSAKDVAAVAQVHAAWHAGRIRTAMQVLSGADRMTNAEVVDYVTKHPGLADVAPIVKPIATSLRIPVGAVATVYLETRRVDEEMAEEFFSSITEMKTSGRGDPIAALLRRTAAEASRGHRMPVGSGLYLLARTWNAWIAGDRVEKFVLGSAETGWNEIPTIEGAPKRKAVAS